MKVVQPKPSVTLGGVFLLLFGVLATLSFAADIAVKALPDDPACGAEDRRFMARAYEVANDAIARGDSAYGALLVKDGKIVLEFSNDALTSKDVTHHAETGLISIASRKLDRATLAACTLYTSTEPCIMCCGSIRYAGIRKWIYGTTSLQVARLRGRPIPSNPLECREVYQRTGAGDVVILGPLMEKEGLAIHATAMKKEAAAK